MTCKNCGTDAGTSNFCPNCGVPILVIPNVVHPKHKDKTRLKIGIIVILAIIALGIIGRIFGGGDVSTDIENNSSSESIMSRPVARPSSNPAPIDTAPKMTVSQEQATRMAGTYLEVMAFSRKGLIDQLEYEDFSNEDAVFAVNNISVDWSEQAARMAKTYLDTMAFSRQGLIDQLEYEGFTHEQAVYGVNAVGL